MPARLGGRRNRSRKDQLLRGHVRSQAAKAANLVDMRTRRGRHSNKTFSSRCRITRASAPQAGTGREFVFKADASSHCMEPVTWRGAGPSARSAFAREDGQEQTARLAEPNAVWWSQTGSNRRPPACKAGALPTELWPRFRTIATSQRWWAREDLNFRPHAYQACALTT